MLPKSLAIIDDDAEYAEFLAAYLQGQGVAVTVFADSDDFLIDVRAFDFEFYIVDLLLPGVDGLDLVRLLRKRVTAGIVVVTGRLGADVFDNVLTAGADMHLAKPVRFEQVALAVKAVHRRSAKAAPLALPWRLDRKGQRLLTPGDVAIDLGDNDWVVLECLAAADAAPVTHAQLCQRLGREQTAENDNWLHATIYRLRRRIERSTPETVPLLSQPRVGYVFRGRLVVV